MTPPHQFSFSVAGKTYPLGHLHPFTHEFEVTDPNTQQTVTLKLWVEFSDHCYTRGLPADEPHEAEWVVSHSLRKAEVRLFDRARYSMSLQLPAAIRSMAKRGCFRGDMSNYFIVVLENGQRYHVYFTLSKLKGTRLRLFVQSAYARTSSDLTRRVRFTEELVRVWQGK